MSSVRTKVALLIGVGGMLAAVGQWSIATREHPHSFLVYDRGGASSPIIVPQAASAAEWRAAALLQHTLAVAAGRHESAFPIRREGAWLSPSRGLFVGQTTQAALVQFPVKTRTARPVGYGVSADRIVLRSGWPEDVGVAVPRTN